MQEINHFYDDDEMDWSEGSGNASDGNVVGQKFTPFIPISFVSGGYLDDEASVDEVDPIDECVERIEKLNVKEFSTSDKIQAMKWLVELKQSLSNMSLAPTTRRLTQEWRLQFLLAFMSQIVGASAFELSYTDAFCVLVGLMTAVFSVCATMFVVFLIVFMMVCAVCGFVLLWTAMFAAVLYVFVVPARLFIDKLLASYDNLVWWWKIKTIVSAVVGVGNSVQGVKQAFDSMPCGMEQQHRGPKVQKYNKFAVLASTVLATVGFIGIPLFGFAKANKWMDPILRMLERVPYVTWLIDWLYAYTAGEASADDIPDSVSDIRDGHGLSFDGGASRRAECSECGNYLCRCDSPDEEEDEKHLPPEEGATPATLHALTKEQMQDHKESFETLKKTRGKNLKPGTLTWTKGGPLQSSDRLAGLEVPSKAPIPFSKFDECPVCRHMLKPKANSMCIRCREEFDASDKGKDKEVVPELSSVTEATLAKAFEESFAIAQAGGEPEKVLAEQVSWAEQVDEAVANGELEPEEVLLLIKPGRCRPKTRVLDPVVDARLKRKRKNSVKKENRGKIQMEKQGWPFDAPFGSIFGGLRRGTRYASGSSERPVVVPPPPLAVDQWYDNFMPSESFAQQASDFVDKSVVYMKEHKSIIGLAAASLFAVLGAAVAAGFICKGNDENQVEWSLEGGDAHKNKKGRGAKKDTRRIKYKQTPTARRLFRPNEQYKKVSGETEDVDDIKGFDELDYEVPSELKERGRKRETVQSKRQKIFKKECIHYKDSCPRQLPVSASQVCGEDCGGRHCVHFAGCEFTPWSKESHEIRDAMREMRDDMLPEVESPKVVAARRRAVYRARQRRYTYTSKNVAQLGMVKESMLGKVKLNYRKYANCVYKYRVNGQFVQTAVVFGDKVHTTLHGYHEGEQEVANFNRVASLPDKIYPTSEDGGVFFHHGVLKGENFQFRPPKNEMAMLISYTSGDESEPNVSVGQISADGYSNFASAKGDCGGIVVAVDDGKIVGTHVAGGKQCNKFEPVTEERVKMWQSNETALLSGMDFQ